MKKMLKPMLLLTVVLLVLTGCSKKSSWTFTINEEGTYTVVKRPDFKVGRFGWQDDENGKSTYELGSVKDGEYSVVVVDEDKKEYTITIMIENGNAEVKTDDGISVDLKKK